VVPANVPIKKDVKAACGIGVLDCGVFDFGDVGGGEVVDDLFPGFNEDPWFLFVMLKRNANKLLLLYVDWMTFFE